METARAAGSATSPNSFRRCYGIQFTKREGTEAYWVIPFDRLCDALGIEHRLTKINHPWTNGQVERMNRTIKEATVRRYYYQSHDHLKQHLHTFLMAYNFAKRLKTLKGLTPYEHICKIWTNEPERFTVNPFQHNVGLNTKCTTVLAWRI